MVFFQNTLIVFSVLFITLVFIAFGFFHLSQPQNLSLGQKPPAVKYVAQANRYWVAFANSHDPAEYTLQHGQIVYDASSASQTVLEDADPKTFLVAGYWGSGYAKDATHVYFDGAEISVADASTFNPVTDISGAPTYRYTKDRKYIFTSYPIPLDAPDPQGPEIQPVAGADLVTFVAFDPPKRCGSNCQYDAQDSHNKYYQGLIVR